MVPSVIVPTSTARMVSSVRKCSVEFLEYSLSDVIPSELGIAVAFGQGPSQGRERENTNGGDER